jgi:hypothetical protein
MVSYIEDTLKGDDTMENSDGKRELVNENSGKIR